MNNFSTHTIFNILPKFLHRHKIIEGIINIFPKLRQQIFYCNGNLVFSNLADAEARQVFIKKKFEDYGYFKLAEFFLPQGGTHFDVGANYGFQTFGMINKLKNKKIKYFLFEPNIDCHNCHNKTATLHPNENIINYPIAITSFNGPAHFFYCKEYSGGGTVYNISELHEKNLHESVNQTYEVSCTVLDTVLFEQNISSVDLLKVDVEGSEYNILKGANTALSKGIIKAAYIEINTEALDNHGSSPNEIFNLLEKNNYKLFYPHTEGNTEIHTLKIYGKELSLSLLNKYKIINDSKDSVVLLDILAIHHSIIKN